MYHLIFVVKIKNNMRVCIIRSGLTSLTLAKALVNQKIFMLIFFLRKKKNKINLEQLVFQKVMLNILIKILLILKKLFGKLKK